MLIDTTKMSDDQIKDWVNFIKNNLRRQKEFKNASDEELTGAVMDGMFAGFQQGELRRIDLKRIAEVLGFEIDEDFMNDPHPDPYDLINKK